MDINLSNTKNGNYFGILSGKVAIRETIRIVKETAAVRVISIHIKIVLVVVPQTMENQ